MRTRLKIALAAAVVGAIAAGVIIAQQRGPEAAKVDALFVRWNEQTPGCAVGVSSRGSIVLEKAYGMADLEHAVRNAPETVFEAGSVSKQFTAAAVLLLARAGKLSLDDPARKYVPELPDYGTPLTIRHMLNHTSGLRDWGSVAAIAGWPRTTRVYTHAHVLDIVGRQRSLNFPPGTRWSYSNTGYNLAAIIVSRASGQSFAEFTRTRIFEPLGMSHTSWRDDFRRIVKGRAIAYADERGEYRADMPFENVHGNGGLLTTVGDLLRWTRNFAEPKIGDAAFIREEQTPGRFSDGRSHDYALGLTVGEYKGVREVRHSGSTAGYRAYLADYPDRHVSVAVLCNVSSADAPEYAHAVAELFLGGLEPTTPVAPAAGATTGSGAPGDNPRRVSNGAPGYTLSQKEVEALVGMYRNTDTGEPLGVERAGNGVRLDRGGALRPVSANRFRLASGATLEFAGEGRARMTDRFGTSQSYERAPAATPDAAPLAAYAGTYVSDEADVSFTAAIDGDTVILRRRPNTMIRLTPVYADAFRGSIGVVQFRRDQSGAVTSFAVSQDRVWSITFRKTRENGH
jgi:CubicO group peptidase (beta-lactamase class C family)